MTINSTIAVAGMNVTMRSVEHHPGVEKFADFKVDDVNEVEIGRVWEYDGKWRASTPLSGGFVEVAKMLDALEVVVRMTRKERVAATAKFENYDDTWSMDGHWHRVTEPKPADGFLLGLIRNSCPNGEVDPFDEGQMTLPEGVVTFDWEGHNAFSLMVRNVEVWQWYDGPVVWNSTTQSNTSQDGKPIRHMHHEIGQAGRIGPVQWEVMIGHTPFVIGYRMEAC